MGLPFDCDFLQDTLPQEKLAELRRRFMDEWRSGEYTREEMIERYRMSERTFWYTVKRYADVKELDDYTDKLRSPNEPYRKFTDEDYKEVIKAFQIRSDGGSGFDNNDVNDFFDKNSSSWTKVSKPWDNPFAERGIRTIKHEYLNQEWIGNCCEFEKLCEIIKFDYNECCPHQSFDNKTPAEVRIAATSDKPKISRRIEKWDTIFRTVLGRSGTAIS